jgi:GntR family transcriptional regulator, arabinose operon transcriptional repressor
MERHRLNKNSSVVLYQQLAETLKRSIRDSHLQPGAQIPTEFSLAKKYSISRGTVRQALTLLQEEGLIQRIPGRGTFLRNPQSTHRSEPQRRIGVIIPAVDDQLSLNILAGVESVAKYHGCQVVFNHSNECLEQEKEDIAHMRSDQVEGIIIFPLSNEEHDEAIWELYREKFPFVLVDRFFPNLDCDYVIADNVNGGFRATEHLILLGHKAISFIHRPEADFRTTTVRDRYLGYRKALEKYQIDYQENWLVLIKETSQDINSGSQLLPFISYLQQADRTPAVFAVNDVTAISIIAAAGRLGIKIPEELAVVGFDNLKIATQIEHPLTTIHQERFEMGVRAAHLLLERIEGRTGRPEHIVTPTNLVIRETCGAHLHILKNHL